MLTHTDTTERKLKRVKINLMRDPRFAYWRGIMMVGKTQLDETCPTAYTDGCDEVYGPALINMLDDRMVAFVVLHENLHKISRDLTLWRKLFEDDAQLANMACDYRHNLLLVGMDPLEKTIAFPRDRDGKRIGLYDERFKNMDVPTIFRILKQEKEQNGGQPNAADNFDAHGWDKASQRTQEEQDRLDKEVDQAMRQGEAEHRKVHGDKKGDMERFLSELLHPKINWREAMAEFVRSLCAGRELSTWRKPNRRFLAMDALMPSMISERVGRIAVGADMSGSVTGPQVTAMVTEVYALARQVRPEKIDLMYWDTRVARHEEYDETNLDLLPTSTKPMGGGGTSPACVKTYMAEKRIEPECLIMLTDGYVDEWPVFDCPVLWVVTTKTITAPNGVTIHLEDVQ